MEHVACLLGCVALLLVSKDQVDPMMQLTAHIVRLQSLQARMNTREIPEVPSTRSVRAAFEQETPLYLVVEADEFSRVSVCPRRELDVVHAVAVLVHPKVKTVDVDKEGWRGEELGNQLFDVPCTTFSFRGT
jgi:hypothetical protein